MSLYPIFFSPSETLPPPSPLSPLPLRRPQFTQIKSIHPLILMGFAYGVKRPIAIMYKRMSSPVSCREAYSTYATNSCWKDNASIFNKQLKADSFRVYFTRNYSSEVSSSDQTNLIKQLRQRTSAPIKDVKTSLVSCNWDIEAAQKDLRKRGVVLASKKSSRTAAEGLLALAQDEKKAVVVELNCETDFVARNEIFQYLALSLARTALFLEGPAQSSMAIPFGPECLDELKSRFDHPKLSGEKCVQTAITEMAAMMGENVKLGGGFTLSAPSHGVLSTYLHTSPQPGIGRIIGILSLEVEDKDAPLDAVQRVGSEIAMHVVAAKPLFLTKEDVSPDALGNERDILRSQAESTGKSQLTIDKMVEGRLRKYFEEVVLMEQKFVVDDSVNIKTLLNNLSKEVGSTVKIGNFLRVEVGEGLKRLQSGAESFAEAA